MDRYQDLLSLAEGQFGIVHSAFSVDLKKTVAIKVASDHPEKKKYIMAEYEILRKFLHPHIVHVYEAGIIGDKPYFVMEYARCGTLLDYRNNIDTFEHDLHRQASYQLISALAYLHALDFVHLDIKLENILILSLVPFHVLLADFGFARHFKRDYFVIYDVGSELYFSPELVYGIPVEGPEIDIWALGIVLYSLFFKRFPLKGNSREPDFVRRQIQQIRNYGFKWSEDDPRGFIRLIEAMLAVDHWMRKTAIELLHNPWVANDKRLQLNLTKLNSVEETKLDSPLQSSELSSPELQVQPAEKQHLNSTLKKEDVSPDQIGREKTEKEPKKSPKTKIFSCLKI